MQLGIGVPYQKLSSKCEFRENRHSDGLAFKAVVYEFLPNCSYLFTDLDQIRYRRCPLNAAERWELTRKAIQGYS